MVEIEGEFGGEMRLDPIKFSKILKKKAIPNNKTSGKVNVPHDYIGQEIFILLPTLEKVKK